MWIARTFRLSCYKDVSRLVGNAWSAWPCSYFSLASRTWNLGYPRSTNSTRDTAAHQESRPTGIKEIIGIVAQSPRSNRTHCQLDPLNLTMMENFVPSRSVARNSCWRTILAERQYRIIQRPHKCSNTSHRRRATRLSNRLCNFPPFESSTSNRKSARRDLGCLHMGGLPALHVNTTLLILINAFCAVARFQAMSATRTKIQERRRVARCASRAMRDGGYERHPTHRWFHGRRTMPKPYKSFL